MVSCKKSMAASRSSLMCSVSSGDEAEGQFSLKSLTSSGLIVRSPFSLFNTGFRIFKSKGAVLVLLWSFCALHLEQYLLVQESSSTDSVIKNTEPFVVFVMSLLLYPALGWLADVFFGRYEVIKWSLRIVWAFLILSCLSNSLLQYFYGDGHTTVSSALSITFYLPISLGLGGIVANIIQFGTDQLAEASSNEMNSFFRWIAWLFFLSGIFSGFSQWCICSEYKAISYLPLPTLFTVAVTLDHLCNHWLVKESSSDNPFALIYKVLRYAIQNKYPRLRSAFTYGEEKPYTRIDLAKSKYGGPFSTEQVEDVKTFFRIIGVLTCGSVFVSMFLLVYPSFAIVTSRLLGGQYYDLLPNQCEHHNVLTCFQRTAIFLSGRIFIIIVVPIYEVALHLLLRRWFSKWSILWRLNVGLVLLFLSLISCIVVEFAAVHEYSLHHNVSIECAFNVTAGEQDSILPVDYKWMMISDVFVASAQFLILTSFAEFLCAQSPYSMKGLLFGFIYGMIGFFVIVGYAVSKPLQDHVIVKFMSLGYGCMAWYLVLNTVILLVTLLIFCGAYKCYRSRFHKD